jgi:MtN3 and saliva related transmembrane protein
MFLLLVVGILAWLVYGILISSLPLVIANLAVLFLAISILIAKLKFK